MNNLKLTVLLLLALGLTACGGSDDSANANKGSGGDKGTELDRCIEQAILNGAKTGAEALAICTNGNANPSIGDDDIVTPKYQSVLVKGISMSPADKILESAVSSRQFSLITGLVICDNSVVTPNRFNNAMIEKSSILNEWRGDKQYAGYHKVSVDGRDDNCLVQATDYKYTFPASFGSDGVNTIYRKGKVAHIDMISTLAMARLMRVRSYSIIEDILEGQNRSTYSGFDITMNKGHFDKYRAELPSNDAYEAAEEAIINEIKATTQYTVAANKIDAIIASTPPADELLDAYNNLAERAKLLAALHEIINDCAASHGLDTCSNKNIITQYSEGNDFKAAFGL